MPTILTPPIPIYDPWSTKLLSILTSSPGPVLQDRTYGYTPAGDMQEITDNVAGVTYSYSYDKLHRLIGESTTDTTPATAVEVLTYTYDNEDHVHAVSAINRNDIDHAYDYDANGNMTGGPDFTDPSQTGTRTISYNADNLPVHLEQVKGGNTIFMDLMYDGTGGRAMKTVSGMDMSTTYYIGKHYQIKDGTATKFIFAGNMRIAMVTAAGTNYFHKDHLGSSTVITDSNGAAVETTAYMPFGTTRSHTGTDTTNYKFTDQELDPESGLYNYGARLYDPVIGRFISADTLVPDFSDPQSFDRYAYCRNNPLIYIDPSGNFGFIAAIVGACKWS